MSPKVLTGSLSRPKSKHWALNIAKNRLGWGGSSGVGFMSLMLRDPEFKSYLIPPTKITKGNVQEDRFHWPIRNSPGIVTIGVPAHRTSIPVVCPLQSGVSRQTSASWPLLTCSSLGATGEKMMRFWGRPMFCAYCWILGSPTAGKRNNQSTLLGTRFRI